MIRCTAILSLTAVLLLLLYLPSAHPPEQFLAQLRTEHETLSVFWNSTRAERVLDRTLRSATLLEGLVPHAQPPLKSTQAPPEFPAADELSALSARLVTSQYFRSLDALLHLARYRFFCLAEWLPPLIVFGGVVMTDALVRRSIKARQFGHHNPEAFAAYAVGAVILLGGIAVLSVLPVTVSPWLMPIVHIALYVLLASAIGQFHRR